jgi:hypothetical protein
MATPLPYTTHAIPEVVARIDQGDNPWVCLNRFLHDWWCYAVDERLHLISQPPVPPHTSEGKRWAAFCAATVEELCLRTSSPCPVWIKRPAYTLDEPWFYFAPLAQDDPFHSPTPEPFRQRNIFVGASVLDNKYELQQLFGSKPRWEMWSDEELQQLTRSEAGIERAPK